MLEGRYNIRSVLVIGRSISVYGISINSYIGTSLISLTYERAKECQTALTICCQITLSANSKYGQKDGFKISVPKWVGNY